MILMIDNYDSFLLTTLSSTWGSWGAEVKVVRNDENHCCRH
jgi:anthranilate/para-aminobenzoate synthase component II